jgi:hypothetical protein
MMFTLNLMGIHHLLLNSLVEGHVDMLPAVKVYFEGHQHNN